jgi:hypothetical protein
VLILGFWGYFIVVHIFGGAEPPSRPLTANDFAQLAMMLLWLLGLAVAWRWELVGAVATLTGAMIGALLNQNAVALALIPCVPAVMFLLCWWWSKAPRHENRSA